VKTSQIEQDAIEVLEAHHCLAAPVDVLGIAQAEGIELAPGDYGEDFSGRIEYHSDQGKFILFHPDTALCQHPNRVRFSIGHELGHYYLEHHRELLLAGAAHNSTTDFICDEVLEREADEFAASLLIPHFALKAKMAKRSFMTLSEVLKMAEDWQSSATSAAIRYAKFTREACIVILSENEKILFWLTSEEAAALGFRFVARDRRVPVGVPTALITSGDTIQNNVKGAGVSSELWFPDRHRQSDLWEDACRLGGTGRVLTLLALSN
jgi:hypothetical protein